MAALGLLHICGTPANVWVSQSSAFFWAFFFQLVCLSRFDVELFYLIIFCHIFKN